jgi:glycosyltransferase involved in cell wall biosynthesis
MKILFISEYYPPKITGGGEINLALQAEALVQQGTEVLILTAKFPGLAHHQVNQGVKIFRRLKTGKSPNGILSNLKRSTTFFHSVVRETRKLCSNQKFDAIHLVGIALGAAPELTSLNVPLFATIESYPSICPKGDRIYHGREICETSCSFKIFARCQKDSPEMGKMKNRSYMKYNPLFLKYIYNHHRKLRRGLAYCNLIAISDYVQKLLKAEGFKSVVLPNCINLDTFQNNAHIKRNVENNHRSTDRLRIIYMGSLTKFKGPQILLKALAGLNHRCDIYGEGPLKPTLQKMIDKYHLNAEIHLPVPFESIPDIYNKANLVVFPSIWPEPFGRISIEAGAAGKSIIASAIAGITSTVSTENGILVEPGNVEQLRQAIKKMEDKKIRDRMGKAGKRMAKSYSQHVIAKRLLTIYKHPNEV